MSIPLPTFPLYDQLLKESQQLDVKKHMANDRLGVIASQLNPSNRTTLYTLIIHHATLNGNRSPTPYGANLNGSRRGVTLGVKDLPIALRDIIECFLMQVRGE